LTPFLFRSLKVSPFQLSGMLPGFFAGFGSRKVCLLSPPQSAGRGSAISHGPSSEAPSGSAQAPSGPLPSPPVSLSSSLLPSVSASDFDDAVDESSSAVMPESFPSASASDPLAALVASAESA